MFFFGKGGGGGGQGRGREGKGREGRGFLIIIKVCGTFGSEGKIMMSNSTCGDGVVVSSEPPSVSNCNFCGCKNCIKI